MTLLEAIAEAAALLSQQPDLHHFAGRDAELLFLHVTGDARTVLYTDSRRPVSERDLHTFRALIARRAAGEPIQYITGEQEFYGISLKVTPAVLIPRPETELLVEAALERLPKDRRLHIIDVGTGSGAIAIAVAKHLPMAMLTAVDLSKAALAVAEENAARNGLSDRVVFLQSDLLQAVATGAPFDAVLSNPPYIPITDREHLHRQVRDHEPETALFAGDDGLAIYRRLIPQAATMLRPGGLLALEFGYGQRPEIQELLREWDGVHFLSDLQGIPRVALALAPVH